MIESIAFYLFAALTLASFLVVVTTNNLLYAISSLAFGLIIISSFFFLLDAEFLGIVQITVYTGGVVVIYAFAMMLFDSNKEVLQFYQNKKLALLIAFLFAATLIIVFGNKQISVYAKEIFEVNTLIAKSSDALSLKDLANSLFTKYIVAFEIAGIMLLMAMIAGISTGFRKVHVVTQQDLDEFNKHKHREFNPLEDSKKEELNDRN